MSADPTALTKLYCIANALMCSSVTTNRQPIVLRTSDETRALGMLRSVARLADLQILIGGRVPSGLDGAPPCLVVVTGDDQDVDAIAAARNATPGVHIALLVDEARRKERLGSVGRGLVAAGLVDEDPELEPHQQVPSSLI